jgi:hypothetical protein
MLGAASARGLGRSAALSRLRGWFSHALRAAVCRAAAFAAEAIAGVDGDRAIGMATCYCSADLLAGRALHHARGRGPTGRFPSRDEPAVRSSPDRLQQPDVTASRSARTRHTTCIIDAWAADHGCRHQRAVGQSRSRVTSDERPSQTRTRPLLTRRTKRLRSRAKAHERGLPDART